ncbi:cupredoxin domain-containing protein [Haloprofundus marisrubri]|uniref:cupredoxin domain-containing protein n=1 Tax=Haloprofundus marisrubri TaxID=1514971 RepID=UPI0012BAC3C1|nr:plastocyanin/azurin family copper-binding protein [Haloprofundus marisrubri]
MLKLLGAGAALSATGTGVAAAQHGGHGGGGTTTTQTSQARSCPQPNCIDPELGYTMLSPGPLPQRMRPTERVQLLIGPKTLTVGPQEPPLDFYFEPVGLRIDPGTVVSFDFVTPEHGVTGYHVLQGRQQRVPESVPPLTSPTLAGNRSWLYRFDEPGVYDLFCPPHEAYGMAMRIVVGDEPGPIVRGESTGGDEEGPELRPPLPASAAVLDDPQLQPQNIVDSGRVSWASLNVTGQPMQG